jgi:site-specific recombinase XerD
MAALSDAAVIDVTAADQSRVKAGCRTGGNHVKMPWRLSTIAGFYRYAVEEELLDRSPAAHVRRPRVDYESHAAALDRNELGALLVAAGLRACLRTGLAGGMYRDLPGQGAACR